MKFKTEQEAFNHYRTASLEEIERRAAEIKHTVATDAAADVPSLNVELAGLQQAKNNLQEKGGERQPAFNPITGMSFPAAPRRTPEDDAFASTEYRRTFFKTLLG